MVADVGGTDRSHRPSGPIQQDAMASTILPARHQPPLPRERLILDTAPDAEAIEMDVVIVGGGPGGLATAIELMRLARDSGDERLAELQVAVLEKSAALGEHCLSGAVINPLAFRELFPDTPPEEFPFRQQVASEEVLLLTERHAQRIPTPPSMRNEGFHTASLCEVVRWLGERAEESGVNLLPGFPVASLLTSDSRVTGVRTVPAGLDRGGDPGPRYEPATDLTAKVVVLAEGSRGPLAAAYLDWQRIGSDNPQIFALGVKELWETRRPLDRVIHTLGWPLPRDAFGGSFMYPLETNLVALGLVVGLDYSDANLDVHHLLQRLKLHPYFRPWLEGGEMVEWGAKTIPEGGFHSLPSRRSGNGVVIVGDSAGFVDVPSLKGIHYAMMSGIFAARAIFRALQEGGATAESLAAYDRAVDASFISADLYRSRNMRLAFRDGFLVGGARAGLMALTGGRLSGRRIEMPADAQVPRQPRPTEPFVPDGALTFSKVDAVFRSGNQTRDDIPNHLVAGSDIPGEVAEFYQHVCPAGVYERQGDRLVVNAPNCIDCRATDILGPRWTPREGGSGPAYKRM